MRISTSTSDGGIRSAKISLSLASTPEEVREVQRLRYKVFTEAIGLSSLANPDGLAQDDMDAFCEHLIVRNTRSLKVVGSYRVLTPRAAARCGRLQADHMFDLDRLEHLRSKTVEAGRACIHPDYRGSGVLPMLWAGLFALMKREGCEYLAGCASISLADGGYNATALYQGLETRHLAPLEYRVEPRNPFILHKCEPGHVPFMPPLLEGYLRSGAWVCGEPAWDADCNSADLFLLLPVDAMHRRRAQETAGGI
jgi:putative hemolysin